MNIELAQQVLDVPTGWYAISPASPMYRVILCHAAFRSQQQVAFRKVKYEIYLLSDVVNERCIFVDLFVDGVLYGSYGSVNEALQEVERGPKLCKGAIGHS